MDEKTREVIVDVLLTQALADHLGDVRDAEESLWKLLGVGPSGYGDAYGDGSSAFQIAKARLAGAGIPLPQWRN